MRVCAEDPIMSCLRGSCRHRLRDSAAEYTEEGRKPNKMLKIEGKEEEKGTIWY
jgi:hypothetical protein